MTEKKKTWAVDITIIVEAASAKEAGRLANQYVAEGQTNSEYDDILVKTKSISKPEELR